MKCFIYRFLLLSSFIFIPHQTYAGIFEIGAGFSINRSNYNDGSYTWTRRYSASFGYFFTQDSELEFSFQDSITRTVVTGVQDVSFHDQVYSLDLNYHFLDEASMVRPFVKGGVGQLNRDATGTYSGGYSPPGRTDQISAVLGAGMKVKFSQRLGFKAEVNTYLLGGAISTWKDNLALMLGGSFFF